MMWLNNQRELFSFLFLSSWLASLNFIYSFGKHSSLSLSLSMKEFSLKSFLGWNVAVFLSWFRVLWCCKYIWGLFQGYSWHFVWSSSSSLFFSSVWALVLWILKMVSDCCSLLREYYSYLVWFPRNARKVWGRKWTILVKFLSFLCFFSTWSLTSNVKVSVFHNFFLEISVFFQVFSIFELFSFFRYLADTMKSAVHV